jgi:serine/threonine protein kinase
MNYNKKILKKCSKGTFGTVFTSGDDNVYKVTHFVEENRLLASNINEMIIFNKLNLIKKQIEYKKVCENIKSDINNKNPNYKPDYFEDSTYFQVNPLRQIGQTKPTVYLNKNSQNLELEMVTPITPISPISQISQISPVLCIDPLNHVNLTGSTGEYTLEELNSFQPNSDEFSSDDSSVSNSSDYFGNFDDYGKLKFINRDLINFNWEDMSDFIKDEIIMQTKTIGICDNQILLDNFIFEDKKLMEQYQRYLSNEITFLIFNKLRRYNLTLTKIMDELHIHIFTNFDIYAKKILKAVGFLHHNGFLHGDLKSENILIDTIEDICLTDFGAVKLAHFDNYFLTCTLTSRCPEDLEYEYVNSTKYSSSGFKSDIWSLGIIFTELILGYNPVTKLYKNLIATSTKNIELRLLNHLKQSVYLPIMSWVKCDKTKLFLDKKKIKQIYVIEQMLRINPYERLSSVEEVYEKLFGEKFIWDYKIKYSYDYLKFLDSDKLSELFTIRKEYYNKILDIFMRLNILYMGPLVIDIFDRIIINFIHSKLDDLIEILSRDIYLLLVSVVILCQGLFNNSQMNYKKICKEFKIDYNEKNIEILNYFIVEILHILDYDIYRPFNIFNCTYFLKNKKCSCTELNKPDIILIHNTNDQQILLNLLTDIILNDQVGLSPDDYRQKLFYNNSSVNSSNIESAQKLL